MSDETDRGVQWMLDRGWKPCVGHPDCPGMFHPDRVRMDYTGWEFPINRPDNSPVHDHRTE